MYTYTHYLCEHLDLQSRGSRCAFVCVCFWGVESSYLLPKTLTPFRRCVLALQRNEKQTDRGRPLVSPSIHLSICLSVCMLHICHTAIVYATPANEWFKGICVCHNSYSTKNVRPERYLWEATSCI